jgi:hypothetical protein
MDAATSYPQNYSFESKLHCSVYFVYLASLVCSQRYSTLIIASEDHLDLMIALCCPRSDIFIRILCTSRVPC